MIVNIYPLQNFAVGTHSWGPVAIADNVTAIKLRIARCTAATPTIWPSASVSLEIKPEILIDGTWRPYAGSKSNGGIVPARGGADLTHETVGGYVPPGTGRQFKGVFIVAGGTLRSSAEVDIT